LRENPVYVTTPPVGSPCSREQVPTTPSHGYATMSSPCSAAAKWLLHRGGIAPTPISSVLAPSATSPPDTVHVGVHVRRLHFHLLICYAFHLGRCQSRCLVAGDRPPHALRVRQPHWCLYGLLLLVLVARATCSRSCCACAHCIDRAVARGVRGSVQVAECDSRCCKSEEYCTMQSFSLSYRR